LVLSQVSEKIITFIRTYLKVWEEKHRRKKLWLNRLLAFVLKLDKGSEDDLNKRQIKSVPTDEQPRVEFAITKLSLLVGTLLAAMFHADLYAIIGNPNPHTVLQWTYFSEELNSFWIKHFGKICAWPLLILKTVIGFISTGFLLTFGSKFFHDLLEILYETKLARRKLTDEYIYRSPTVAILDQRLASVEGDPVRTVLERHQEILLHKFSNIVSIERSFNDEGVSIMEIRLHGTEHEEELRRLYQFDYPAIDGNTKLLSASRIKVIANCPAVVPHLSRKLFLGFAVAEVTDPSKYGSLGFFARRRKDQVPVFVTCGHVFLKENSRSAPIGSRVWAQGFGNDLPGEVGTLTAITIDPWLDTAVVQTDSGITFENFDLELHRLRGSRNLNLEEQPDVWLNGATSPRRQGRVRSQENIVNIKYGENDVRTMRNLIKISAYDPSNMNTISVSAPGDSGAVLMDSNRNAVGMIVAGNDQCSYAIPITRILDWLDLDLAV
jgi:hypothetical protein